MCRGMIFGDFFRQHSKKASSSYNVQSPAAAAVRENCTVVPPHSVAHALVPPVPLKAAEEPV